MTLPGEYRWAAINLEAIWSGANQFFEFYVFAISENISVMCIAHGQAEALSGFTKPLTKSHDENVI